MDTTDKQPTNLLNGNQSAKGKSFDNCPENINRNGRPAGIRNQLKAMLEANGWLFIPNSEIINTQDDGVTIKVATQEMIALNLIKWASDKSGTNALKAI